MVLSGQIENEQSQLNQIRADQANFPELQNRLDELNIQLGLDQENIRFLRSQTISGGRSLRPRLLLTSLSSTQPVRRTP